MIETPDFEESTDGEDILKEEGAKDNTSSPEIEDEKDEDSSKEERYRSVKFLLRHGRWSSRGRR